MKSETKTIKKCPKCKHYKKCFGHEKVFDYGCGYFELPVTNFDEITRSPEALAKFIIKKDKFEGVFEADCFFKKTKEWRCLSDTCEECITKWLKQKAEEDN